MHIETRYPTFQAQLYSAYFIKVLIRRAPRPSYVWPEGHPAPILRFPTA